MENKKTALFGASGYSGAELARLLLGHPAVDLVAVTSRQHSGKKLSEVIPRLRGVPRAEQLELIEPSVDAVSKLGVEVAFLALPHGLGHTYAAQLIARGIEVIDLSADFRLHSPEVYREFYGADHPAPELLAQSVYGLSEWRAPEIAKASLIACPGCYPTSILLPLLPLVSQKLIDLSSIAITSMSGVSGAGKKASQSLLYAECNESVRAYGAPKHRHLSEIEQELGAAAGEEVIVSFTPHLVPMNRGIATTITLAPRAGAQIAQVAEVYEEYYADKPFVRLLGEGQYPDTKWVTGSNNIDLGWVADPRSGKWLLFSAIDNLVKGAAGQAVQNLNLRINVAESTGLV